MLKKRTQFQTPIKDPPYFAGKLEAIYTAAHDLCVKDDFGERDLYVAMELVQRYIEILDDIIANVHVQPTTLDIQFQDHTIRFSSMEEFSSWLKL